MAFKTLGGDAFFPSWTPKLLIGFVFPKRKSTLPTHFRTTQSAWHHKLKWIKQHVGDGEMCSICSVLTPATALCLSRAASPFQVHLLWCPLAFFLISPAHQGHKKSSSLSVCFFFFLVRLMRAGPAVRSVFDLFSSAGCVFFKGFRCQSWPLLRERESSQQTSSFTNVLLERFADYIACFSNQLTRMLPADFQ